MRKEEPLSLHEVSPKKETPQPLKKGPADPDVLKYASVAEFY